jgi:hypothetical protein
MSTTLQFFIEKLKIILVKTEPEPERSGSVHAYFKTSLKVHEDTEFQICGSHQSRSHQKNQGLPETSKESGKHRKTF